MTDKQQATFGRLVGFCAIPRGISAALEDVRGHPRLGDEPIVHTPRLCRLGYNESGEVVEVETRNTIYRKDTSHDPASYAAATAGQRETVE